MGLQSVSGLDKSRGIPVSAESLGFFKTLIPGRTSCKDTENNKMLQIQSHYGLAHPKEESSNEIYIIVNLVQAGIRMHFKNNWCVVMTRA